MAFAPLRLTKQLMLAEVHQAARAAVNNLWLAGKCRKHWSRTLQLCYCAEKNGLAFFRSPTPVNVGRVIAKLPLNAPPTEKTSNYTEVGLLRTFFFSLSISNDFLMFASADKVAAYFGSTSIEP
jgi:hypothetical protein